jgi:hypothetical protein
MTPNVPESGIHSPTDGQRDIHRGIVAAEGLV